MKLKRSELKMIENEVIFRQSNLEMQASIEKFNNLAQADGEHDLQIDTKELIHFICECSDENCRERIEITPDNYNKLHASNRRFIVINGHQVPKIEKTVVRKREYQVVRKNINPPEQTTNTLHTTDIDNS